MNENNIVQKPYLKQSYLDTHIHAAIFSAGAMGVSIGCGMGIIPTIGVAMIAACIGNFLSHCTHETTLAEREVSALDYSIKTLFNKAQADTKSCEIREEDFELYPVEKKLSYIGRFLSIYENLSGVMSSSRFLKQSICSIRKDPGDIFIGTQSLSLLGRLLDNVKSTYRLTCKINSDQPDVIDTLRKYKDRLENLKENMLELNNI